MNLLLNDKIKKKNRRFISFLVDNSNKVLFEPFLKFLIVVKKLLFKRKFNKFRLFGIKYLNLISINIK